MGTRRLVIAFHFIGAVAALFACGGGGESPADAPGPDAAQMDAPGPDATISPTGELYDGLTPTMYAAPTAIGTGSGDGEANAMALVDALATAVAGDVVGVLPGVYTAAPSGERWDPLFQVTNNGTEGNPIIVVGKYDQLLNHTEPTLRTEIRSSDPQPIYPVTNNVPGLGVRLFQQYIEWRNFYLDWDHVPPAPSNGMSVIGDGTVGIRFRKIVYRQAPALNGLDNWNAIFVEGAVDAHIDHCYVFGGSTTGINQNASAITVYPSNTTPTRSLLIEHNTFEGVNGAIFIKGRNTDRTVGSGGVVRFNRVNGCTHAGIIHMGEDPTIGMDFYQNLIVGCHTGIKMENALDNIDDRYANARIYSNTIVDSTYDGYRLDSYDPALISDFTFRDNIVAFTAATTARVFDSADPNDNPTWFQNADEIFSTLDHNLYYEAGGLVQFRERSGLYSGLSAWQGATAMEAASDEADPGFVDAAGGDYRLAGADTGSSTGGPRGCYLTGSETIGNGVQ